MAALLTSESSNTDMVMRHIAECREQGLKVQPPDINLSVQDFTVAEGVIRFGMAAVKNVGLGAVEAILEAREEGGPFAGLHELCERVDLRRVNRRVLESLIKCGAFDSTGAHRAQLMAVLDEAIEHGQKLGRDREGGQSNMFAAFGDASGEAVEVKLPNLPPWSEADQLAYEKDALGFYITGHPLSRFKEEIGRLGCSDSVTVQNASDGMNVRVAGLPTDIKEKIDKKGRRMAFVRLEDLTGSLEVIVFPDCYAESAQWIAAEEPVMVEASVDRDERSVKLKANKILPLSQAAQSMTNALRLKVGAAGLTRDKLVMLRQTLERHRGQCRVYLHLRVPGKGVAVLALPRQYCVKPDAELVEQVNDLFGHNVVDPVISV
jgi:DNA polymerase-3 subunit alpha